MNNLERTGGGLLTNGRTKPEGMPQVPAMKPQQRSAPPPSAPPQAAPQAPPSAAGMPQGAGPPPTPQGVPGPQDPTQGQSGVNDLANNALALMHDESFAPQVENLIQQSGEEGAAEAAVMIGKQVVQAHMDRGIQPDPEQASDAIMEVVGDLADMGMGMGAFPDQPRIAVGDDPEGVPAAVFAIMALSADKWTALYPEFGESLKQEISQATQQDGEAARQVAAYMQQREQNANQGQPTPNPSQPPVDSGRGRVASAPEPAGGYLG